MKDVMNLFYLDETYSFAGQVSNRMKKTKYGLAKYFLSNTKPKSDSWQKVNK